MSKTKKPTVRRPRQGSKDKSAEATVARTSVEILRLPGDLEGNHVQLYSNFVRSVVRRGPSDMTDKQLLIATVLATEAIADHEELLGALDHLKNIRRDEDGPYVSWTSDKVTHRVRVSSYTCLSASRIKEWPQKWDTECSTFFKGAPSKLKLKPLCNEDEFTSMFFVLAQSWYQYILPAPCANHLANTLPLTLLPAGVLDRRGGIRPKSPPDSVDAIALNTLADAAVDQLFGAKSSRSKSSEVVAALKGLFKRKDRESVKLANFLEKQDIKAELTLLTSEIVRSGCPVSAVLVLWVVHLLEWGSVRLKNPTIGTIRAYLFSLLDRLYSALIALNCAPIDISQEGWIEFFGALMYAEGMDNVAKNALLSFHRCLVLHLGIQPIVGILNAGAEVGVPKANFLWPHEHQLAYALIPTFTSDPRLIKMLGAMLGLGMGQPVRISDLPGIRRMCINTNDGKLRIDLFPSRGHHRGKSAAAPRPLDYTDSPWRHHIDDWIKYRDHDDEVAEDYLIFGDPNRPGKCYMLGLCLRLLNQILKEATGDDTASFHMLRHTQICAELTQDLINAGTPTAIKKSDQMAARAGQKSDLTTYLSYFHTPETVMRFWIDQILQDYSNSPAVAALWLGKAPNTLTQAQSRHKSDEKYLENLLAQAARQVTPSEVNQPLDADRPARPLLCAVTNDVSFQRILYVLNSLYAGKTVNVIANRNDITVDRVIDICSAIIAVANTAVSPLKRIHLSINPTGDAVLQAARALLKAAHCRYPIKEPVLSVALENLMATSLPTPEICAAAQSWLSSKHGKYIALTQPDSVAPFLSFLLDAEVPRANFFIAAAVEDSLSPTVADELLSRPDVLAATYVFERLASTSPQVIAVSPSKGRSEIYLMLSRIRIPAGKVCPPAAGRTNRIHALMLAAAVWIAMSKSKGTNDGRN
jgi:hypothetical protein